MVCINIWNCCVFLLDWTFGFYIVFFVFCKVLCFKIYFCLIWELLLFLLFVFKWFILAFILIIFKKRLYFSIFLIFILFLLYSSVLFLPYTDMNPGLVHMCSPCWIPLPPRSPSHPSGSSQCTSHEHPVSWIEPGLVIHFTYDNLHVSVPFSHIIQPSPSPKGCKRLF